MNIFKNKIMMTIVLAVCASIMPQLFFKNGFLLSYFLKMGLKSSDVLILLSLPSVILFFLSVPSVVKTKTVQWVPHSSKTL
ncbi:MAG: hypothetical protein PF503_04560 [Desulfobacula sp.]|jgi:hypothetical protein|nr:hypothetical protein [Desulfobacula sp.]